MPTFRTARVTELLSERRGLQRVTVSIAGDGAPSDEAQADGGRAYVLTDLVGPVAVGDEVVVNTTAVDLRLGTGGWHVVHWNLARRHWNAPGGGHIMKLRYTSLQVDTGAYEEHHPDLASDLAGTPVVVCTLHSQVAVVAAGFAHSAPGHRLVYVMTDGGALPLALSDLVHDLRAVGLLAATVTAGHAFGGDAEAVSVASALAVARHGLHADAIVVGMGPGVVGTGSNLGTTAIEQASILDTATALGATAIACVRASDVDSRVRHRGISHHTRTTLGRLTRSRVSVAIARGEAPEGLQELATAGHCIVAVTVPDVDVLLESSGISVTSMGRGPAQDPQFFRFAAAAGIHAGDVLTDEGGRGRT